MARPLRIECEGAFCHVAARGNEKKRIFLSKADYEKFLDNLKSAAARFSVIVHCYVLMGNRCHLIVETPKANLSVFMHAIQSGYTTYFNRKRDRSGHLFQGRFKSVLVDADSYLLELSRCIHLKPRPRSYRRRSRGLSAATLPLLTPLGRRWSSATSFSSRRLPPLYRIGPPGRSEKSSRKHLRRHDSRQKGLHQKDASNAERDGQKGNLFSKGASRLCRRSRRHCGVGCLPLQNTIRNSSCFFSLSKLRRLSIPETYGSVQSAARRPLRKRQLFRRSEDSEQADGAHEERSRDKAGDRATGKEIVHCQG